MQQQMTNLTQLTKFKHVAFLLLLLLGFASADALAKGPSAMNPDKGEVERYLHGKYKIKGTLIQEREDAYQGLGHWRSISLEGDLTSNDVTPPAARNVQTGKDLRTRARAIARIFLAEEADLLSLTPISEMREASISEEIIEKPSLGPDAFGIHVGIGYDHYLNGLRLDGTRMGMRIGPTGKILSFNAYVVDITPALLLAVKQPGLPQVEIRRSIKKDLIAHGLDPDKVTHLEDEKYAIPMPPYVVWKALMVGEDLEYALEYVIDAFTGQIIRKNSSLQY